MVDKTHKENSRLKAFCYLFIILMLVWFALTLSLEIEELVVGFIVSIILTFALFKSYQKIEFPKFSIKRLVYLFIYVLVLFKEIIIANFDVAYRILHPKMPINPGVVTIKTELKQDLAKMILANSITLTPGTFTLDINDDSLIIHWMNMKTDNIDEATKVIGRRFEKYLKVIFKQ